MKSTMIFDGIGVAVSAELFGADDIHVVHQQYPTVPFGALEDFCYGVICCDRIAVSGKLDPPGPNLLSQFSEHVDTVEMDRTSPEVVLEKPKEIEKLLTLIEQLDEASSANAEAWRAHMLREVDKTLGDDPSLAVEQNDPDAYRFKKDLFRKEFARHPQLRSSVPPGYVGRMFSALRDAGVANHVCDAALRYFIPLNAMAHLLIFVWYQQAVPSLAWFTPFATRASLLDAMPGEAMEALHMKIGRTVGHSLVADIIAQPNVRYPRDFLNELKSRAFSDKYNPIRQKLAELTVADDPNQRKKLLAAVERAQSGGLLQVARRFVFPLDRSLSLIFARPAPSKGEYRKELSQFFFGSEQLVTRVIMPTVVNTFNAPVGSVHTGSGHQVNVQINTSTLPAVREIVDQLFQRYTDLSLATDENRTLNEALEGLRKELLDTRPQSSVLAEGLSSVRHILEHAAGAYIGHEAASWLPQVVEGIKILMAQLQ